MSYRILICLYWLECVSVDVLQTSMYLFCEIRSQEQEEDDLFALADFKKIEEKELKVKQAAIKAEQAKLREAKAKASLVVSRAIE